MSAVDDGGNDGGNGTTDRLTYFERLYGGAELARVKAFHDPDDRLTSLYDKVVRRR